jgi:DNA-binding NarL/FixJ family response regulator
MQEQAVFQTQAGSSTRCSHSSHSVSDLRLSRSEPASAIGPRRAVRIRPQRLSVAVGQRPALQLDAVSRELNGAGFDVRCAATTCADLIGLVAGRPADLALVHAALDPSAPLGFVDGLRDAAPGMAIVVLFDDLNPALAHAALAHEVDGVVLGDSSIHDLVMTLERVAAGEAVYPGGWLHAAHRADGDSIEALLSARQRDVLELLAAGHGNSHIAACLHISPNTVKFHVRQIYQRLGVKNRVEATLLLQADHSPLAASHTTA